MVWAIDEGYELTLEHARGLAWNTKIHPSVLDSWAALLNRSERIKAPTSLSRMFFSTRVLVSNTISHFDYLYRML